MTMHDETTQLSVERTPDAPGWPQDGETDPTSARAEMSAGTVGTRGDGDDSSPRSSAIGDGGSDGSIDAGSDTSGDTRDDTGGVTGGDAAGDTALFANADAERFRGRWQQVQTRFVDDPRAAVQEADSLVADVTNSLTARFADQKSMLEQQWSSGDGVDTEDLRVTLQRYRTLFERLLAA